MRVTDIALKLLGLTEVIAKWRGMLAEGDRRRRERIARYADEIAGTIGRAAAAFERLEKDAADRAAERVVVREFGRLKGYVENIVGTLDGRVDGRQLAGVRRRLEALASDGVLAESLRIPDAARIERLAAAEGWFRALADGLRA